MRSLLVPALLLLSGCSEEVSDDALACSLALRGGWLKAPSEFNPRGVPARRLSPEDRQRMRDSRLWRTLSPSDGFINDAAKVCGAPVSETGAIAVSKDGAWARVVFRSPYQEETCLARRDGTVWRERECDITMIADPI